MQLSREDAKKIESMIREIGGSIDSEGQIKVETVHTHEIEYWLELGAYVYLHGGYLRISNWVQPEPKPLPPGEYTCKVTTNRRYDEPTLVVEAVITEGEYKGRSIPIKPQSEDC